MNKVSFLLAFFAGVLSFVSPCVLPLIPGYVSFITGITPDKKPPKATQTLVPLVLFAAGFTLIFTGLGASVTIIGSVLTSNKYWLTKIAGLLIILVGLLLMGLFNISFLTKSSQQLLQRSKKTSSFVMGMAFAIGWTPCIGLVLSGILLYASTAETASLGSALLFTYSLGLAIPFIVLGQAFAVAKYRLNWLREHAGVINKISGLLLVVMGVLLFTDQLSVIAVYLQKLTPWWKYF